MALRIAIASGLWTSPTTWSGGIIPSFGDDVNASGAVIGVNVPINVGSLFSTGGGYYQPTFACTSITCTGDGIVTGAFSGAGAFGLINLNGGYNDLTINSKIVGGAATNGFGVYIQGSSTITFNGEIIGGTSTSGYGVYNIAGGSLTFNGTLRGNIAGAVRNTLATTINVTGDVFGGSGVSGYGMYNSGAGTTNFTGNLTAGVANAFFTLGTGLTTSIGTITASNSESALNTLATARVSTPCINSYEFNAIESRVTQIFSSSAAQCSFKTEVDSTSFKNIYSAGVALGNPSAANVRSGTVYGASGELTGTLAVPNAESVQAGVPFDNLEGTYYVSASQVAELVFEELLSTSNFTVPNTFGKLVKDSLDVKSSEVKKNTDLIPAVV